MKNYYNCFFLKNIDQINNLQAELLSQKSRIHGNSLNNTLTDLTNIGENLLLYSFLEDSQEPNNNLYDLQGNLRKKLKKTLSHDIQRFNSQKAFKNSNENYENPLKIQVNEKNKTSNYEENEISQRKLGKENENLKVYLIVFFEKNGFIG